MRTPLIWAEFLRIAETVFGPIWEEILPVQMGVEPAEISSWRGGASIVPEQVMADLHARLAALAALYRRSELEPDHQPTLREVEAAYWIGPECAPGYWARICADAPEWTFPEYLERVTKH